MGSHLVNAERTIEEFRNNFEAIRQKKIEHQHLLLDIANGRKESSILEKEKQNKKIDLKNKIEECNNLKQNCINEAFEKAVDTYERKLSHLKEKESNFNDNREKEISKLYEEINKNEAMEKQLRNDILLEIN